KEEENDDNNTYDIDQNSSIRTTLILEDIINLRDPIFQERDTILSEVLIISNNTVEETNLDFDPECFKCSWVNI
ncbi:4009_t:CDS:2, partial [Scutellospora calospora]